MSKLPFDIARCWNDDCELRKTCMRYLSPNRLGYRPATMYPGGKTCRGYIHIDISEHKMDDPHDPVAYRSRRNDPAEHKTKHERLQDAAWEDYMSESGGFGRSKRIPPGGWIGYVIILSLIFWIIIFTIWWIALSN